MEVDLVRLRDGVELMPCPPLSVTVAGAHLYGLATPRSDVDLRGIHLAPVADGTDEVGPKTVSRTDAEVDLVSHDLAKFAGLVLRGDACLLEELLAPTVVVDGEVRAELVALAPRCVSVGNGYHYRGFANNQWLLFRKRRQLKQLLYTFRVLLTGITLMRSGRVEAHLPTLADGADVPAYLDELIAARTAGECESFDSVPGRPSDDRVEKDVRELFAALRTARHWSSLPRHPLAATALDDLVRRQQATRPAAR